MFVAQLIGEPGTEYPVGAPLLLVVDSAAEVSTARMPAGAGASAAAAPAPSTAPAVAAAGAGGGAAPARTPSIAFKHGARDVINAEIGRVGSGGAVGGGAAATASTAGVRSSSSSSSSSAAAAAPAPTPVAAPVAAATSGAPPHSRAGGSFTDVKASGVRKVIAARLSESKATIPHAYAAIDCNLDALLALRTKLKAVGVSVSVNDLVIAAAARALKAVPEANAYYDAKADAVRENKGVDVSVAVATDGGLITPIVKGADGLGLTGISSKVKDLAGRARAGKLKPEEYQGGSFTISNLGASRAASDGVRT